MDGVPQTTFIPRKPVSDGAQTPRAGGNMFLIFGTLVLVVAVLISLGIFAYQQFYLNHSITADESTLQSDSSQFNSGLISNMTTLSNQLAAAGTVLQQHTALSNFFTFLSENTIVSVRFTSFSYSTADGDVSITLQGQAANFAALDAQENQFGQPNSLLQSPAVSGVAVTKTGNVTFTVSGTLASGGISYEAAAGNQAPSASAAPAVESAPSSASSTQPLE